MDQIFRVSAVRADALRGRILKRSMAVPALRAIFCRRWARHAAWFLASVLLYLPLAIFFPLALVVVGPIVYGVPHLFASVRYVNRSLLGPARQGQEPIVGLLLGAAALIAAAKLCLPLGGAPLPELLLMAVVIAGFGAAAYGRSWRQLLPALLLLAGFAYLSLAQLALMAGALALGHNFVAFAYWLQAAKDKRDKIVAASALAAFAGVHAGIFLGAFDGAYRWLPPLLAIAGGKLSYQEVGWQVVPWSNDGTLLLHATVAFAFGQAIHYLIWLKLIPEQHHARPVPASFAQSFAALKRDFGRRLGPWICGACLLYPGVWLLQSLSEARVLYFAVASFHGYLEIAGLLLMLPRGRAE